MPHVLKRVRKDEALIAAWRRLFAGDADIMVLLAAPEPETTTKKRRRGGAGD
jgi:hypothetical protein